MGCTVLPLPCFAAAVESAPTNVVFLTVHWDVAVWSAHATPAVTANLSPRADARVELLSHRSNQAHIHIGPDAPVHMFVSPLRQGAGSNVCAHVESGTRTRRVRIHIAI
jgi:hypothetical protein